MIIFSAPEGVPVGQEMITFSAPQGVPVGQEVITLKHCNLQNAYQNAPKAL